MTPLKATGMFKCLVLFYLLFIDSYSPEETKTNNLSKHLQPEINVMPLKSIVDQKQWEKHVQEP